MKLGIPFKNAAFLHCLSWQSYRSFRTAGYKQIGKGGNYSIYIFTPTRKKSTVDASNTQGVYLFIFIVLVYQVVLNYFFENVPVF